jgi:asparagine synthase (glutamine-hydrolysing)
MAMIPQVLAILDEPFADASLVPTFLLSRFARRHVTVALGGDGGDELLLGYPTFAADRLARLAARLPARLRRDLLAPLVARLRPSSAYMSLEFRARRFLGALDLPPDHRHPTWIGGVHPAEHAQALAPGLLAQAPDEAVFSDLDDLAGAFRAAWPDGDRLSLLAWQMLSTYLADGVLTKVDRASMAHGLEVRAPLLDARLVTLAGHLPSRLKLRRGQTKVVMRRMLAGRVPAAIVRRPKQGFGFPVGRWLAGPLRPWLESVLARDAVAAGGLLDPAWVSGLVAEHVAGRRDHRKPLWTALALELWRRGPYGPGG